MSDSYHYERVIKEADTPEFINSYLESIADEIKRLEALIPIARARALFIEKYVRHYYRVTVFYHDSKHAGVYRPGKYDPALNRWLKDYSRPEVKGAYFSVRVDHRIYSNGILKSDEYDQGASLSFGPKEKETALKYVEYLEKLYGIKLIPRDELIKRDPEIRNYAIILGSLWYYWLPGADQYPPALKEAV